MRNGQFERANRQMHANIVASAAHQQQLKEVQLLAKHRSAYNQTKTAHRFWLYCVTGLLLLGLIFLVIRLI